MDLCTYYVANLPVIQLKNHLAGIVKQNGKGPFGWYSQTKWWQLVYVIYAAILS